MIVIQNKKRIIRFILELAITSNLFPFFQPDAIRRLPHLRHESGAFHELSFRFQPGIRIPYHPLFQICEVDICMSSDLFGHICQV